MSTREPKHVVVERPRDPDPPAAGGTAESVGRKLPQAGAVEVMSNCTGSDSVSRSSCRTRKSLQGEACWFGEFSGPVQHRARNSGSCNR